MLFIASEACSCEQFQEKPSSKMEIQPRETKLEARVAKFIFLSSNVSMMKQQMMEIGLFPIPLLLVKEKKGEPWISSG